MVAKRWLHVMGRGLQPVKPMARRGVAAMTQRLTVEVVQSCDRDPLVARAGVGYGLDYAHVTEAIFKGRIRALAAA
jgi:hypothetical protein